MKAIARVTDAHTCPLTNPAPAATPHTGGPILPTVIPPIMPPTLLTVFAGGLRVAVVGSQCTCAGPPDVIQAGSSGVFIGNRPVARQGDATAHGGLITGGLASVQVG
ncbi:PAAR domain-containing protein [Spirosoma radiotolerans]|uniref:Type VI secretion protein n=1 Tax=Spirosoma radiotolerans TaxID=1379870 RepID=A0A0E3ZV17_9BACT|nr:PAAR domain-containing protein [Spirosoma radiotolerans]AKD55544.1 hypothetical protein SD10_12185 [Spirosoma radiotolerans]